MSRQNLMLVICLIYLSNIVMIHNSSSQPRQLMMTNFAEILNSGKTWLVYFGNKVNAPIELFLKEFDMSAEVLEDYGILTAKVNCTKQNITKYCTSEHVLNKVHLFRAGQILQTFVTDTVFDVNAIVAHVLFAVLFNEVKYVQTPGELQSLTKAAKGRTDVVFAHVQALGIPEHRAVMEAAFVYGTRYQFVLSTGGSVLKFLGVKEPRKMTAGLWFLHCKMVPKKSESCRSTTLRKLMTSLNVYIFLKLMDMPLVMEVSMDPDEVVKAHQPLHFPLLFLFTHRETLQLDRNLAESVAWKLRGDALVVLVNRDESKRRLPEDHNAAFILPGEVLPVKYLTLKNAEEAIYLFEENETAVLEDETKDYSSVLDILDDEVAESVYRERSINLESYVPNLTAQNFTDAISEGRHTVVLFYNTWDAVSMAFMQSYFETALLLRDATDVTLACINCADWTEVCMSQNATQFPVVILYSFSEMPQQYCGMLGTESLYRFIRLRRIPSPLILTTENDVESFLSGEIRQSFAAYSSLAVLGLFNSSEKQGCSAFQEASQALKGEIVMGLYCIPDNIDWSLKHTGLLPVMLFSRSPDFSPEVFYLKETNPQAIISAIRQATFNKLVELTLLNLPSYLQCKKPLLILFVNDEEKRNGKTAKDELSDLQNTGFLDQFVACWLHLDRTPVGRAVLEFHLGFLPQLPVLILIQINSGSEVFVFPAEYSLLASEIQNWLHRVQNGDEEPVGELQDENWGPTTPLFDFLALMDEAVPGFAAQKISKSQQLKSKTEREKVEKDKEENIKLDLSSGQPVQPPELLEKDEKILKRTSSDSEHKRQVFHGKSLHGGSQPLGKQKQHSEL
ncbi:TXD16 protein, partial [Polypterus senegalus]